jgi:archaellum biogenesis protein FlaJ (TadC family)
MEPKTSSKKPKLGVIFTFLSLIGLVWIYEWAIIYSWNTASIIFEVILIIIFITGFIVSAVKTGCWKYVNTSIKNLEEKESIVINKALKAGYALFSVIALCLLLVFAIIGKPMSIVMAVALILLAYLIPISIIAWTNNGE